MRSRTTEALAPAQVGPAPTFLAGGGDMGARLRRLDWAATPLGPPEDWPQPLRAALSICLHSAFPTAVYWGPELRLFYNDAWAPIPAERYPAVLGRPAAEVWPDIWDIIGPQFARVLATGEGFSTFDQLLPLERGGRVAETWWNYSFTPIRGEDGAVAGVFNQGHEITGRVLGERRSRFLLELTDRLRGLSDPAAVIAAAEESLGRHLRANRTGYGEVEETARFFTTGSNWTDGSVPSRAGTHDLAGFGPEVLAALRAGQPLLIPDVAADPRTNAPATLAAFDAIDTRAVITASLVKDGRMRAALYVHAREPRPWTEADAEIVTEVAERTWSAVERARAEAETRATEERLRQSEEAFRTRLNAIPQMVWSTRPDGWHDFYNDRWYEYTGTPQGSTDGEGWNDMFHPDDRDHAWEVWRRCLATGEPYEIEYRLRHASGAYRWVLGRALPIRDAEGAITRWMGTCTDIDELRRATDELRRVSALLGDLNGSLEAQVAERTADRDRMWRLTTDIMLVARFDGTINAVNPAWERLLGWAPEDLLGRSFLDLVHPEDRAATEAEAAQLARGLTTFRFENRYRARDGSHRWISWIAVPEEGLIHAVGRDVTAEKARAAELQAAQEALRQAQKMEAVGQLTGGIAHDFNNLLTGISGSLDLLGQRVAQGRINDLDRYITASQGAARRAAALTHRLLAFSRRQTLDPRPTDANRLVQGMEELVRRTVGPEIALKVVASAGLWATLVDPHQLENALLNLCINARDAMPDGGRLTIETGNRWMDAAAARRHDLAPGQYISLCVTDTGVGMTPEVIGKAFDPFFTTKPLGQGTGLGLSMIYGFARQSGGQVRIDSEPGQGTTVCLYLPRHAGAASEAEPEPGLAEAPRARAGETVLVVDDEPTVRMLVTEVLEDLGYAALEAADGAAGLRLLQSDARIDLLVTDVGLPGGMNGRQMADAARMTRPGLKVLFITGYAENAVVGHGHLDPGIHMMTKPFNLDLLAARIRELIAAR